jgi:hypothetical protein
VKKTKPNLILKQSNAGFTIIEILVASSLILMSGVFLASSYEAYGDASEKVNLVIQAGNLESAVVQSFSDAANFSGQEATLRAGNLPNPLNMGIRIGANTVNIPLTGNGIIASQFFQKDLTTCAGFSDVCIYRLELAVLIVQRVFGSPPSSLDEFAFAYRITINPNLDVARIGNLGVTHNNINFSNADYIHYLPRDLYRLNLGSCTASGQIAMHGFDRDTGEAVCLNEPVASDSCGDGQIAKSLQFEPNGNRLRLNCVDLNQTFTCPPHYSFVRLVPAQLDNGSPGNNWCIHTAASTGTHPNTYSGVQISGQICPAGYSVSNSCTSLVYSSTQGSCNMLTPSIYDPPPGYDPVLGDPLNGWIYDPPPTTVMIPQTQSFQHPAVANPPQTVSSSSSGSNINCAVLNNPPPYQSPSCLPGPVTPATHRATTSIQATCVLVRPLIQGAN